MSNQTLGILAVALVAQLGLAAVTNQSDGNEPVAARPLVEIEPTAVVAVDLWDAPRAGEPSEPVHIVKRGADWVITSSADYPAEADKILKLVEVVNDIEVRAPIASQSDSHDALKVGVSEFTRRIVITTGETTTELRLGAASNRGTTVRLGDEADVYRVVDLSPWTVKATSRGYYDPVLIKVDHRSITSLSIGGPDVDLNLRKAEDMWVVDALEEGLTLDQAKVTSLVRKAVNVRIADPVGKEAPAEAGFDTGIRVSWTAESDGQSIAGGYVLGAEDSGRRWLQADDEPYVVKVYASSFKDVIEADLGALTVAAPDAPASP